MICNSEFYTSQLLVDIFLLLPNLVICQESKCPIVDFVLVIE